MGWASGSELAEGLWAKVKPYIKEEDYRHVAGAIIDAVESEDCDTVYECEELVRDAGREEDYSTEDEE